eukprot:938224-Pleurochrysis_carterae.AAC.1
MRKAESEQSVNSFNANAHAIEHDNSTCPPCSAGGGAPPVKETEETSDALDDGSVYSDGEDDWASLAGDVEDGPIKPVDCNDELEAVDPDDIVQPRLKRAP